MTSDRDMQAVKSEYLVYPAGRYQQYENKIQKAAKIVKFVRRHRIAFAAALLALAAVFFCLTYCMGIFTQDIECADLIYGEEMQFSAKAFLTDVRFEYAVSGSDSWTDTAPVIPGEYDIRAVSENLYGKERYSGTSSFTFYARDTVIDIPDTSCEYGDLNDEFLENITRVSNLADGDKLTDMVFSVESESWKKATVYLAEYRIVNAEGNDVTASYNGTTSEGNITVDPRNVTIYTDTVTKVYDGTPIEKPEYSFKKGSLAEGDELQIFFRAMPTNAGTYSATPDNYTIFNSDGEDVTNRYNIRFVYGVITIEPRKLTFTTGSAEKVYDGKPLTDPEWELVSGTVAEGHVLTAEAIGKRTIAGTGDNTLDVTIVDEKGRYVADNYEIIVKYGTLTITPITLKFETDSAKKVYDGQPLQAPGYKLVSGELLPGHTMQCRTNGWITNAGEGKNTLYVNISNERGDDVTYHGYRIEVDEGTLKITPRPITVTSDSAQKLFDGTPLTAHSCKVTEGSLVNGHTIKGFYKGSQTEVGESANNFFISVNGVSDATTSYASNYAITYVYGTLKVLPNPNYNPGDMPNGNGNNNNGNNNGNNNNGDNHNGGNGLNGDGTDGSMFDVGGATGIGFPNNDGHERIYAKVTLTNPEISEFRAYLRATSYGDYNGSGFDAATNYIDRVSALNYIGLAAEKDFHPVLTMHIERLSGCPVIIPYYSCDTSIFGAEDSYSRMEIYDYYYDFVRLTDNVEEMQKYIHGEFAVEMQSYSKYVYEEYLQIPEYTKQELLRIGKEHGIYETDDEFALAAQIQRYVQNAGRYNLYGNDYPEGVDVAVYFLDVAKEGVCQHFAAAATMMFRAYGIPARYVTGFAVDLQSEATVYVSGKEAHAWVEVYFDFLGWIPVEVTGYGEGAPNSKMELIVNAYSATKEYDGKIFSEWNSEKVVITKGNLLPGHTMKVSLAEGRYNIAPGVYENRITDIRIYDADGNDVTDRDYSLRIVNGQMTIKKRKIVIQLESASKKYDGTPLKCEEWRLVSGTLLPNTDIFVETSSQITDVGKILNAIMHVYVYETKNGVTTDVSSCYEITVLTGYLEITE